MRRSLVACRRGGTDFVQLLILIGFIAFIAIGGARLLGDSVRAKFTDESQRVLALEGGAPGGAVHTPGTTTPGAAPTHAPGPTTPGAAPTHAPGPTTPGAAPTAGPGASEPAWPAWLEPIIRYGPAIGLAHPALLPALIADYYTVGVSPSLTVGGTAAGIGAAVSIDPSDPTKPPTTQFSIKATDPRTWLTGAAAAQAVLEGNVDNTKVVVSAPVPTGLAKKVLRKVLAERAVGKLVGIFPDLEVQLAAAIKDGIRALEAGGGAGVGVDGFKVKVGARVFAAEDGSWGISVSLGLVQFGHITQSVGIKVTARPRDEPVHETWLRGAIQRYKKGGLTGLLLGADSAPDYDQTGAIDVIHPDGRVEADVPLAEVRARIERGELAAGGVNGALNSRAAARGNLAARASRTGQSQVLIYYPQGVDLTDGSDRRAVVADRVRAIRDAAANNGFSWSCHSHSCHVVEPQLRDQPNQALEAYAPTQLPGAQDRAWDDALAGAQNNVVIIRGDHDELAFLGSDDRRAIADNPHVRQVIVPGASHAYVELLR